MDTANYIKAFEQFLKLRYDTGMKHSAEHMLIHDDFALPSQPPEDLSRVALKMRADTFTRELTNGVNRFYFDICQADCWVRIAETLSLEEKAQLLFEFAEPLLELSVSRPYSIRNHFIFATTHLLHPANKILKKNGDKSLPADDKINFNTLEKLGKDWACYTDFAARLGSLNDEEFRKHTSNFRHCMEHRFKLNFDEGVIPFVRTIEISGVSKEVFGAYAALNPKSVLTLLYNQQLRSKALFNSYWNLLQEMIKCLAQE